ncbi:MAG: MFS transporter [Spirochaetales bacterium]|nr:MFS transporter [Spirochaetales bacterium]
MNRIMQLFAPYRGMRREIYIIFLAKTINAMGALIFPFMTLLLSTKIGLSGAKTGFYVALTGMLYAPASLIGGKLADSWGRKPVLVIFELLSVGAYIFCLFIEPGMTMVYALMAASVFFGVAGPSHDAMTADLTTPEQREGAYSLNYLGFNLGFAFAQMLAGFLFRDYLKVMFLIDAVTALFAIAMIAFFVGETHPDNEKTPEQIKEARTDESGKSILSVLLSRPVLLFFALAAFGYKFVYSQWPFLMPLHAEAVFPGSGAKLFGLLGTTNALIVVFGTPLITSLTAKKSNIRRIFYGGALFTIGFGLLGFTETRTAFFLSVLIFTTGEILEAISTMPFIMNHTPASHRGRMSSVLPLIMGAGYSVGPIVMGGILDKRGFSFSWILAASIVLISTFAMKGIDLSKGGKPEEELSGD